MSEKRYELIVYTDGGSRGNPGPSAAGFILTDTSGTQLQGKAFFLGESTNNVAEYMALEKVLEYIEKLEAPKLILLTDSTLVHNQIKKLWKIKDKKILDIYLKLSGRLSKYDTVDLRLIPREENREADKLVNKALDSKELKYDGESNISFGEIED